MKPFTHKATIPDSEDHNCYEIHSYHELSEAEVGRIIPKKSLHEFIRTGPYPGREGTYKFIKIAAKDGWEEAE